MLHDQIDSNGEEISNKPFEDLAAEEEEEENGSTHDEFSSDNDSGVEHNESSVEDESESEELKQFMLLFARVITTMKSKMLLWKVALKPLMRATIFIASPRIGWRGM